MTRPDVGKKKGRPSAASSYREARLVRRARVLVTAFEARCHAPIGGDKTSQAAQCRRSAIPAVERVSRGGCLRLRQKGYRERHDQQDGHASEGKGAYAL